MFFINAGAPDVAYPGFLAVWFLLYTLLRKDNRKRTIVVLIALLTCFIGLGIAAFRGISAQCSVEWGCRWGSICHPNSLRRHLPKRYRRALG